MTPAVPIPFAETPAPHLTQAELKRIVAETAATEVTTDMLLGVGTGSTVDAFIDAMARLGRLPKIAVSSSERSARRMEQHGIQVVDLSSLKVDLDLYIDGADEIDGSLCMIKGGGAALTREKIVAGASKSFLCIADASKCVPVLGKFPLPVEFIPLALEPLRRAFEALGGQVSVREGLLTDNGLPVMDVQGLLIHDPLAWEAELNALPGVVTHGIFATQHAHAALIGLSDGRVERVTRN